MSNGLFEYSAEGRKLLREEEERRNEIDSLDATRTIAEELRKSDWRQSATLWVAVLTLIVAVAGVVIAIFK